MKYTARAADQTSKSSLQEQTAAHITFSLLIFDFVLGLANFVRSQDEHGALMNVEDLEGIGESASKISLQNSVVSCLLSVCDFIPSQYF